MLRFLGGGLLGAVVALFVASLVIFAGTQLLPGNAASVVLGRNGNPAAVEAAATSSCTSTGPAYAAVRRLARRVRARRPRQLGGRHGAGRDQRADLAADLRRRSRTRPSSRLITALLMIPLSLGLGVLAAVLRGQPARPRHLDRLAGGDRAARVRDRLAADRRLLRRRSTGCRRSRSSRRARARSTTRPSSCCRC